MAGGTLREVLSVEKVREVLASLFEERQRLKHAGGRQAPAALEANRIAIEYWQDELRRLDRGDPWGSSRRRRSGGT